MNFLKPFIGMCVIGTLVIASLGALSDGGFIPALIMLGISFIVYKLTFNSSKKKGVSSNSNNISPNAGMPKNTQSFYYCNDCRNKSVARNVNPKYNKVSCGTCGSSNTKFTSYMCTCMNMNNHMGSCSSCGTNHF